MPIAQVRSAHDTVLMPVDELEEELRRGRLADTVYVQHPEWTGEGFVPAREIPALREVLAATEASMCAHLRKPGMAWVTAGVCGLIALAGLIQGVAQLTGFDVIEASALGFQHTLLDGAFWSPFSGAATHLGVGHLGVNLPVLAYCGYRCERVLGAWGVLFVYAFSLLLSSMAILQWSDMPVVGSSVLAYGVWGGQIALGFRHSAWIPAELQGRYGVGSLVIFLPLAFVSLFDGPGVSLVGHAGGLVGGVLGAVLATPLKPRLGRWLAMGAWSACAVVPWIPAMAWAGPWSEVTISKSVTMSLPSRWAEHRMRFQGMYAWSSGDRFPVYAGTFVGDGKEANAEAERALWSEWLRGAATVSASGEGPARRYTIRVENPEEPWTLIERVIDHDGLQTRAGYLLPPECAAVGACAGRREIGEAALESLMLAEP